jgi:anti-sigma factor RsiW
MTCHETQSRLSLYLYGELDFAAEEAVERHLSECAFCQQALAREKRWHTAASAGYLDVPLELLAESRQELRSALRAEPGPPSRRSRFSFEWPSFLRISPNRWSYQLALASFLVFVGFTGGRFVGQGGVSSLVPISGASVLGAPVSHVRDIQPNGTGRVRILVDEVHQREVIGSLQDQNVRRWLLVAVQDSPDPGIRVDSAEMLAGDSGNDVRDALLERVQHDSNAAVRLKALEALQRFVDDPVTRKAVRSVLEHDTEPAIRAAAIDVLASVNGKPRLTPELAATLRTMARSDRDEYLRTRCVQLLQAYDDAFGVY